MIRRKVTWQHDRAVGREQALLGIGAERARAVTDAIADRENPHLAEKVAVATSQVVLDLARDAIKPLVGVDPGPDALRRRIEQRVAAMLAAGVVAEVAAALQAHGPLRYPPLGYDQVRRHLAGELTLDAMAAEIVQKTAQYARRQRTWLRREAGIVRWLPGDEAAPVGPGGRPADVVADRAADHAADPTADPTTGRAGTDAATALATPRCRACASIS